MPRPLNQTETTASLVLRKTHHQNSRVEVVEFANLEGSSEKKEGHFVVARGRVLGVGKNRERVQEPAIAIIVLSAMCTAIVAGRTAHYVHLYRCNLG